MYNLKEIVAKKPSRFTAGHRMCAGCGAPVVARMILRAVHEDDHVVVSNATGCMEVSTCIYPYTAWTDSYIHTAFESASATESGVEAAYKSLKRQGKLPEDKTTKFITLLISSGLANLLSKICSSSFFLNLSLIEAFISVSTQPGAIAFTRIGANCLAKLCIKEITPALLAS